MSERDFLFKVLKGDMQAVYFCETLFRISQTLDDLVDRDKPVSSADIFRSYWEALISLPGNPFYRANEAHLRPLMAGALQDWFDATSMEHQSEHGRTLAFVLRDQLTSIVVQCAGIVGGFEWMQTVSTEVRLAFHDETLGDYMAEFNGGGL